MVEQERQKGTMRVHAGTMELFDGRNVEETKRALLEAGFDLDVEGIRLNGFIVGERIKLYRKEEIPECTNRRF